MLAVNPRLAPEQVHWLLDRSAVDLGEPGRDNESGFGLIDGAEAVRLARKMKGGWNNRLAGRRIRTVTNDWSSFDGFLKSNSLGRPQLAVLAAVALRRRRR